MNAYALYGRRKADGYNEGGFEWQWILSATLRSEVNRVREEMIRDFKDCEFEVRYAAR